MVEHGKITLIQFIFLIIGSRLILQLTYNMAYNFPPANQDVWISTLLSFIICVIFLLPVFLLARKYPDKTIIQYSELLLGRIGGKIIGLLYAFYFLHVSANTVRLFGEYFTAAPMPETPLVVFLITLVLVAAYAVYKGVEAIGRVGEMIIPLNLIVVIIISLMVIKDINFNNLKPLLEKGIYPVLYGAVISASRAIEPLLLAMLYPYINSNKKRALSYVLGIFIAIVFLVLIDFQILSIIGINQAKLMSYPYVNLLRRIKFADIIERVDIIHLGIWILGNCLRAALYFYLGVLGLAQVFSLKSYKPAIIPAGVVILLLALYLYPNLIRMEQFLSYKTLGAYNLFFVIGIPSILLLLALFKKKP